MPGAALLVGEYAQQSKQPHRPEQESGRGAQRRGRQRQMGTIGTQTNAKGETEYTLTTPDGTLLLDAGPVWFFGDAYPLAPFVGKQVTVGGEQREGSTQIDVMTVDGSALREPGKPPWAGGWKRVGEKHPGWSQGAVKAAVERTATPLTCPPAQLAGDPRVCVGVGGRTSFFGHGVVDALAASMS